MGCARWTEAISALADGEPAGIDERLVAAHVARCPSCRAFEADAQHLGRPQPVAGPPPDLPRRISRLAAAADRAATWSTVRVLLAVIAVEIIAVSVPALLGDERQTSTHAARHLGAFAVAYGVGLLVVVARPARARAMLPVAAVLAGALLITSIVELAQGRVPLVDEASHTPELVSVVLVWLIAARARRPPDAAAAPDPPSLRVVDDEPRRAG